MRGPFTRGDQLLWLPSAQNEARMLQSAALRPSLRQRAEAASMAWPSVAPSAV